VRLILDNELAGTEGLSCTAPAEMLDALVRVWLGIGKAIAERGTRVTLVAAVRDGETMRAAERALVARGPRTAALQLGARVTWQAGLSLASLVERRSERQIVVSCRPRRLDQEALVSWVVVPEVAWTRIPMDLRREPSVTYPYPAGSAENRASRRAAAQRQVQSRWHDLAAFSQIVCWTDWTRLAGDHVARPVADGSRAVLEVIP
jgi:hypothetical protein